jgi:hypothetical protein
VRPKTARLLAALALAAITAVTSAGCQSWLDTPVSACPSGQHWTANPGGQQWKCVKS